MIKSRVYISFLIGCIIVATNHLFSQLSVPSLSISGGGYPKVVGTKFNFGLEVELPSKSRFFKNELSYHLVKEDYVHEMDLLKSYNQIVVGKTLHLQKGMFFIDLSLKTGIYYFDFLSSGYYLYSLGIPINGSPKIGINIKRFSISGGYNFFFVVGLKRAYKNGLPDPVSTPYSIDLMGSGLLKLTLNFSK